VRTEDRRDDISAEYPKPWTEEVVRAADVVVTTGCGDACPIFPGRRYEDGDARHRTTGRRGHRLRIAAQRLSPTDTGLQLLQNSITTVFGLGVLILVFGPVSGAHFNPVVSADAVVVPSDTSNSDRTRA
jgi:hypothetical protein